VDDFNGGQRYPGASSRTFFAVGLADLSLKKRPLSRVNSRHRRLSTTARKRPYGRVRIRKRKFQPIVISVTTTFDDYLIQDSALAKHLPEDRRKWLVISNEVFLTYKPRQQPDHRAS
jgi:hypothetical protein